MPDATQHLEELLAHQQHLLDQLNTVVTRQELENKDLGARLTRVEGVLERLVDFHRAAEITPDERPPHY